MKLEAHALEKSFKGSLKESFVEGPKELLFVYAHLTFRKASNPALKNM